MTTSHILLNTRVSPLQRPIIELLRWKEADDICCSIHPGFRAKPTRQALALMMNQLKIENLVGDPSQAGRVSRGFGTPGTI